MLWYYSSDHVPMNSVNFTNFWISLLCSSSVICCCSDPLIVYSWSKFNVLNCWFQYFVLVLEYAIVVLHWLCIHGLNSMYFLVHCITSFYHSSMILYGCSDLLLLYSVQGTNLLVVLLRFTDLVCTCTVTVIMYSWFQFRVLTRSSCTLLHCCNNKL